MYTTSESLTRKQQLVTHKKHKNQTKGGHKESEEMHNEHSLKPGEQKLPGNLWKLTVFNNKWL